MDNQNLRKPNSNLVWAILTTLFCCLPFGIVAIVKASQVDAHWYAGRYQAAYETSRSAGNWALAAALTSLLFVVIYIVVVAIIASSAANYASCNDYYYY